MQYAKLACAVLAGAFLCSAASVPARAYYFTYSANNVAPLYPEVDTLNGPGTIDSYHQVTEHTQTPDGFYERIASRAGVTIVGSGGKTDPVTNSTWRLREWDETFTLNKSVGDIDLLLPVSVRYNLLGQIISDDQSQAEYQLNLLLYQGSTLIDGIVTSGIYTDAGDLVVDEVNQLAFTDVLSVGVPYTLISQFGTSAATTWDGVSATQAVADFDHAVPGYGLGGLWVNVTVPEPGTAVLLAAPVLLLLGKRRREQLRQTS